MISLEDEGTEEERPEPSEGPDVELVTDAGRTMNDLDKLKSDMQLMLFTERLDKEDEKKIKELIECIKKMRKELTEMVKKNIE